MAVACSGALCAADAPVHVPDSVHGGALRAAAQVELQAGRQERARDLLRLAAQADASLPMRHAEALRAQAGTGAADRLVLAQSANLVAQARSVVAVAEDLARQGRGEQQLRSWKLRRPYCVLLPPRPPAANWPSKQPG